MTRSALPAKGSADLLYTSTPSRPIGRLGVDVFGAAPVRLLL
jgi:hypothetical protein